MRNKVIMFGAIALVALVATFLVLIRYFPTIIWQHGPSQMQAIVIGAMAEEINPGMTYKEVIAILGPGSAGGTIYHTDIIEKMAETPHFTHAFNIDDGKNIGVLVTFFSNVVIHSSPFNLDCEHVPPVQPEAGALRLVVRQEDE